MYKILEELYYIPSMPSKRPIRYPKPNPDASVISANNWSLML